jgi:diguanylate cyclase (GGDEF)-like protein
VGDVAYRYGGDKFLVILPEQDIAGATVAAERVHAAVQGMRMPHVANAPFGVLTISIGVAVATSGKSVKALLHEATTALRWAKDGGRNSVVAYGSPVLQPSARAS